MQILPTKNLRSEVDPEEYGLDISKALVLPVKAGDAIIFDFNLIHASGLNNLENFARCKYKVGFRFFQIQVLRYYKLKA